jgi:hypothetical protein
MANPRENRELARATFERKEIKIFALLLLRTGGFHAST